MVKKTDTGIDSDTIQRMQKRADELVTLYSKRDIDLFKRFREMYFINTEDIKRQQQVDENDWAVTLSPSSRNEVVGMVRLLETSTLSVHVRDVDKADSDKIEKACKDILRISGEFRRARIESDAALSAVLYGPVTMYAETVDDLLAVERKGAYGAHVKSRLEELQKRTPALVRVINAEQSYPDWGDFGMIGHLWKHQVRGSTLKEMWGESDLKDDQEYVIRDMLNWKNRLVWVEGRKDYLFARPHGLASLNIVSRYAGGSSLFAKPEEQMQSFLYAKAMSRIDKRENAMYTALATAINTRGLLGPLLAIDPENAPTKIIINHQGGVRYIVAKAQQVDEKIIDPVIFQWKNILDELSGQSTIYRQTLGENIDVGTFSALAMLSNSGKLPLVDVRRAMEMAFRDIFLHILNRIKSEGIENSLISPNEIPDDIDIEVNLEPDLPQDALRNAQIVTQLRNADANISDEWANTNILNIPNSNEMFKTKVKEDIRKAMVKAITQDPNVLGQFLSIVMGQGGSAGNNGGGGTHTMPDGSTMPNSEMPAPPQTGPNIEQMPRTDAMIPPQERK